MALTEHLGKHALVELYHPARCNDVNSMESAERNKNEHMSSMVIMTIDSLNKSGRFTVFKKKGWKC